MAKRKTKITPQDLWDFVQEHRDKTKAKFGTWVIAQKYRPTNKVMKAMHEHHEEGT